MSDKRKTVLDMVSEEELQSMDAKNENPNVHQPEAPERIWAQDAEPSECHYTGGGWWDDECGSTQYPHMIEYIRADLVQSQIKDAVAAEREACERIVEARPINRARLEADNQNPRAALAEAIRDQGDTDDLAERDKRVRVEALREAAGCVYSFAVSCHHEDDAATSVSAAGCAILALIPEKEKDDE